MFRLVINNDRSHPFQGSFEELERHAETLMCLDSVTTVDIWTQVNGEDILIGTMESLVVEPDRAGIAA